MFFKHFSFAFDFNESLVNLFLHTETLRKYPLSATVNRIAKNHYPIPGTDQVIEKGMWIKIPLLGIHHDPEYYPDPKNFDPDRFSNENIKNRHPMTWLPFGNIFFFLLLMYKFNKLFLSYKCEGEGPRNCIGNRFALMQIQVALVVLLHNFEFLVCSETVDSIVFHPKRVLLSSAENIRLKLHPIQYLNKKKE